jgi:hypothetical protein
MNQTMTWPPKYPDKPKGRRERADWISTVVAFKCGTSVAQLARRQNCAQALIENKIRWWMKESRD